MILSLILFALGALGVFLRRNIITVLMCVELMLNGVNLAFVAFSRVHGTLDGQVLVFFVMVVAAAEAAVGLGHRDRAPSTPGLPGPGRLQPAEGIGR